MKVKANFFYPNGELLPSSFEQKLQMKGAGGHDIVTFDEERTHSKLHFESGWYGTVNE